MRATGAGDVAAPSRPAALVCLAVAVVGTGVAAGMVGALLTVVLRLVQHLAYGYVDGPFLVGVEHASGPRRVVAMAVGGAVVGIGWWALRGRERTPLSVTDVLSTPSRRSGVPSSTADAVLQIVGAGAGASLGREGAPRQVAASVAGWLAERLQLDLRRRRTLIACGAGAGLAAVYNVPLGGTLFAAEVLLASFAWTDLLPAAATSAVATAVAWPVVGSDPTYRVELSHVSGSTVVCAAVLGPVAGLVGVGFLRLMAAARGRVPTGWRLPLCTTLAFVAVGGVGVVVPLVLGNGKAPAGLAFSGALAPSVLGMLLVLKPLVTALCLRAGAAGGLLTPAVATGAALGALVGDGWATWWPGASVGAVAIVGSAAVLAVTQRAPLTATVLALEFTHAGLSLLVPVLLAVAGASAVSAGLSRRRTVGSEQQAPGPALEASADQGSSGEALAFRDSSASASSASRDVPAATGAA